MIEKSNQGRSTIDVWAGIFGKRIIGLVYLPTPIKRATYSQLWHIVNSISSIFSSATQSLLFAAVKWLRAGQNAVAPKRLRIIETFKISFRENGWVAIDSFFQAFDPDDKEENMLR